MRYFSQDQDQGSGQQGSLNLQRFFPLFLSESICRLDVCPPVQTPPPLLGLTALEA